MGWEPLKSADDIKIISSPLKPQNIVPSKSKSYSLQSTVLSQALRTKKTVPIKSKSTNPKKTAPPKPTASKSKSLGTDRWKNHPHSKNMMAMNDEKELTFSPKTIHKKPPPPPSIKNMMMKDEEDEHRKYGKNVAGFNEATLDKIDSANIESLLECMHEGSECLRHFENALTVFAKQQQTQCANFLKLFKKSKSRYAQMDTMPSFFSAISLIHSLLEETVKQSAEFAKFIQIHCLPMIHELEVQCDDKYKEIEHVKKTEDKRLSDIKVETEKLHKSTRAAAQKVVIHRARMDEKEEVYNYG